VSPVRYELGFYIQEGSTLHSRHREYHKSYRFDLVYSYSKLYYFRMGLKVSHRFTAEDRIAKEFRGLKILSVEDRPISLLR
jgi:hypothetical protein